MGGMSGLVGGVVRAARLCCRCGPFGAASSRPAKRQRYVIHVQCKSASDFMKTSDHGFPCRKDNGTNTKRPPSTEIAPGLRIFR